MFNNNVIHTEVWEPLAGPQPPETGWIGLGYKWTLTSFIHPGKCSQNWEQLIYTSFFNLYPRTLSPVRLNNFSKRSGFMLFLCFPKQGNKGDMSFSKTTQPIWERWYQKPTVSTFSVNSLGFLLPSKKIKVCLIHFHSLKHVFSMGQKLVLGVKKSLDTAKIIQN